VKAAVLAATDTEKCGRFPRGELHRISPFRLQAPCQGASVSTRSRAAPAAASIRFKRDWATNARERPSGDQNGCTAPSVPESAGFDAINGAQINTRHAVRVGYRECDCVPVRRYCRGPQPAACCRGSVNFEARSLGQWRQPEPKRRKSSRSHQRRCGQANQERFGAGTGSGGAGLSSNENRASPISRKPLLGISLQTSPQQLTHLSSRRRKRMIRQTMRGVPDQNAKHPTAFGSQPPLRAARATELLYSPPSRLCLRP
jgi:hypothetical protein